MFSRKDLIRLMIPLIIEQILAVLVGMVDVVMVAKVGESAVSGVALVDSINILIIQLLSAMATGGAVVSAQFIGRKDEKRACMAANQLLLTTGIVSILVAGIALIGNKTILHLVFGQVEKEVMYNAKIYFYISAASYPFLAIYNSCAALYRSMGNSKVSMKTSIYMNIINVSGNAICIYLLKMGVEGVAIPTLVSRIFAGLFMLYIILNPKNMIHVDKRLRLGFHPEIIKNILRIGIPNGLENSMFQFGKLMVQSLVSTLGTAATASFAIASNLATIEYLPGNALGLGLITVVGQCVGASEFGQAKSYIKKIVGVTYAIVAVVACSMAIFSPQIVHIYNLNAESSKIAVELMIVHSIAMIVWPLSFTLTHGLRAATDVKYPMVVSICSMWAFRIGLSYIFVLQFHMGVMGVWFAMFVDWTFRAIMFTIRFVSGKWIKQPI